MTVFTNTQLIRCSKDGDCKTVHFIHKGQEKTASAEMILQALGREPNIEGLNLDAAKVNTQNGRIVVDETMRTSQSHIFCRR